MRLADNMNAKQAAALILSCLFLLAGFFLISGGKRATGQGAGSVISLPASASTKLQNGINITTDDFSAQIFANFTEHFYHLKYIIFSSTAQMGNNSVLSAMKISNYSMYPVTSAVQRNQTVTDAWNETTYDENGTAADGIQIYASSINTITGLQINPANQSCNVINAASGQARWTPLAATLATPGYYEGELQVTFADSTVQTGYDVFPIVVRAKG